MTLARFHREQPTACILPLIHTSNANESARGMKILFDKNRINVAVSRAQCMAIVVYSPSLLETAASNIEQLETVNLFCRLVEVVE